MQNYAARAILSLPKSSSIATHLKLLHWFPAKVRSTCKITCLCYHSSIACHKLFGINLRERKKKPSATAGLHHHMSLKCCIKSHCTPATLVPAHAPYLFSIYLHTVRQHLVIVHFLLFFLLSEILFQMMSALPHHCYHLSLV